MKEPLAVYDAWLRNEAAGWTCRTRVRARDGTLRPALAAHWVGPADAVDERALRGLDGPVLDVGCGPGRHLHALARRGVFGLGVDLSPVAVAMACGAGSHAIVGSIFDELPRAGEWRSALLLDGNIGIGGDPARLLVRVCELLAPGGGIVTELGAPGTPSGSMQMRLENDVTVSTWFPWAEIAAPDFGSVAIEAGLDVTRCWRDDGRWFAHVVRPQGPRPTRADGTVPGSERS